MEEYYVYENLNEVPDKWKAYKGAKLSLEQINAIIADAYNNVITKGEVTIPDYGGARERFSETHVIINSLWASK